MLLSDLIYILRMKEMNENTFNFKINCIFAG